MTRTRLLLPLAATTLIAVAGMAGPSAAKTTAKCKRPKSAELVKTGGRGRVWSRADGEGNVVYVACSTKYGKKVSLARDDSASVDQIFHLESAAVSTRKATLVDCTEYEDGATRETVVADLKTGKETSHVDKEVTGCGPA